MSNRKLISSVVAFLLIGGNVYAQDNVELKDWSAGFGAGGMFYEADEEVESGQLYELRLGKNIDDNLATEVVLGGMPFLNKRNQDAGKSAWVDDTWGMTLGIDLIHRLDGISERETRKLYPFLAVGTGVNYYSNSINNDHFDAFGQLGGGLEYHLSNDWNLRGDYRLVVAGHDTEFNHRVTFSAVYNWNNGSDDDSGLFSDKNRNETCLIHFTYDSSKLSEKAKEILKQQAEWLKSNTDRKLALEGHCDERGTNEYNIALGERRAQSAIDYLVALGASGDQLRPVSFGEEKPAVVGSNEAAWAQNRRVVCVEE